MQEPSLKNWNGLKPQPGEKEMERGSTPANAIDITPTEVKSGEKLEPTESDETQPTDSKALSVNLSKDVSGSMSLIDECAKDLHSAMKSVLKPTDQEKDGVRSLDLERVKVAAQCAREIKELIKVKVDAARVVGDLIK